MPLVEREILRRGFYRASGQVVIGDVARWIWNLSTELFPKAVQIVDIYHARENLRDLGNLLYSSDSDLALRWPEERIVQLKAGDIEELIEIPEDESFRHEHEDTAIGYCPHNAERMRYATFRSQEPCISSTVIEAGRRNVIGIRLKLGGMHHTHTSLASGSSSAACTTHTRHWHPAQARRHALDRERGK